MIEDRGNGAGGGDLRAHIAVVGAGPGGIVTALEAAAHGLDVVLVESGGPTYDPSIQFLSEAASWDEDHHAPMPLAVRRQVGGTSVIWGGRCVPYDPVDFAVRPFVPGSVWPVGYEEIAEYFPRACDWLVCGRPVFDAADIPGLPREIVPGLHDGLVKSSDLERWSLPTDFGTTYGEQLAASRRVRLVTGLTATEIVSEPGGGRADHLRCRTLGGMEVAVRADAFVIACGGLEGTRLLMGSTGPDGGELGNHSDQLGRWYMAHAEGVIAEAHFSTDPKLTVYDYERDIDGVYVRRRFTFPECVQLDQELPNIAGWLTNPELPDASHGSGPLSFVYLALDSPLGPKVAPDAQRLSLTGARIPGTPYGGSHRSPKGEHVRNVLRHPASTTRFISGFGVRRLLARTRRAPGFFVPQPDNVYPFQFHGEHLPNPESRVTRSRELDVLGRPKLDIDLRFSPADVDGVVRAHEQWDAHFRSAGVGHLEYLHDDPHEAVERRLGGGFHQIGTTRMSSSPAAGVVDADLAVHGVPNVFVASSSTFVTSGQANSTFMIVAFAIRLADHLREVVRPKVR